VLSSLQPDVLERLGERVVVEGATLRSWSVEDRELLAGGDFAGKVLAPWPNRLRDGRYRFGGIEHRVPITEPERGTALHGLVLDVPWRPIRRSLHGVTLYHVLHPQPGYPFKLRLEVTYALSPTGLTVTLHAANLGAQSAPFGAGFHPYLAAGDDDALEIPARTQVPVDERLLPTGPPRPVAEQPRELDTCFGDLRRDERGVARVRVGLVTLWIDRHFDYVHVYTAAGGVAVEPMTCPPDALNSGDGLVVLEPGASFTGRWGLCSPRQEEER
jgi:aldose 1-epimerase